MRIRPASYLYQSVKVRIERDSSHFHEAIERIKPFAFDERINAIPQDRENDTDPYWSNEYFSPGDARALCGIIGAYAPKRFVEIGSGNSTRFANWARRVFGTNTQITCIDPEPRDDIDLLCERLIAKSFLDVNLGVFSNIEPGDILFLDGSHLTFNGTDTTFFPRSSADYKTRRYYPDSRHFITV